MKCLKTVPDTYILNKLLLLLLLFISTYFLLQVLTIVFSLQSYFPRRILLDIKMQSYTLEIIY